ncbi:MAG: hypothetical protein Q8T04_14625 [Bacteroidota bacterium]|nr:hypothetical protein [Bacteroidota bacterium]
MQLFSNLFQNLTEDEKCNYLFQLLENNQTLRADFIKHFEVNYENLRLNSEPPFSSEDTIIAIIDKAESIIEILEELDFEEPDWDRWHGSNHYVPEYEVARIVAEDEAAEVFEDYVTDLKMVLQTGNLVDIIRDFTAVFHGITCAEINDPYSNLGDPANDFFIEETKRISKENQQNLANRTFNKIDCKNATELAFSFNSQYYKDENEYLRFISDILIAVVKDKTQALIVWEAKQKFNAGLSAVPNLLNKVTKLIGDKKIWIESLESCFLQDFDTSIELMDYYYGQDRNKFEKSAPGLYGRFNMQTLEYLLDKVVLGTPFHISLLKKNASYKADIDSFEKLKRQITPEEIVPFIESLDNSDTKAKFYAHEKLFDQLIELINKDYFKNLNSYYSINFDKAVHYLFTERPLIAWEMIKKSITHKMAKLRSRETYSEIASMLKKAKKIEGMDENIRKLTSELYNQKPNLPALKDEFRKAGLVI